MVALANPCQMRTNVHDTKIPNILRISEKVGAQIGTKM